VTGQQAFGLADVRRLARRDRQFDRLAEAVDRDVGLGREPAAAAAQGLLALPAAAVPLFF